MIGTNELFRIYFNPVPNLVHQRLKESKMKYQLITKNELTASVVNFSNGCNRVAAMFESGDNFSPRFQNQQVLLHREINQLVQLAEFVSLHGLQDHGMVRQAWDRVSHHFA